MTKKSFRVQLFTPSIQLSEMLVLAAARSNAGDEHKLTLQHIKSMGDGLVNQFPELAGECSVESVGNAVHVDAKINGVWHCTAIIEEIEIFEELVVAGEDDIETIF